MSVASFFLLAVLAVLLFVDYATLRRRAMRVLVVEIVVFAVGGIVVAVPEISTGLAQLVGIGRGVDFVLYLTSIWLVRESILNRHLRWEESDRLTEVVRTTAIESAHRRSAAP